VFGRRRGHRQEREIHPGFDAGRLQSYEDNKEQAVTSFSAGTSQDAGPNSNQKHYMVLFFDTSSMQLPDQMVARTAVTKFIDANAGPNT